MSNVHAAFATLCTVAVWLGGIAGARSTPLPAVSREPVAAPNFGTTVAIPLGLRGEIYFLPKDATVLPDFEYSSLELVY